MGLPLQIFGKGSLFGPYTPLQQLDMLADHGTKSYIVGSTNSLLLQQKDRYSDILINVSSSVLQKTCLMILGVSKFAYSKFTSLTNTLLISLQPLFALH